MPISIKCAGCLSSLKLREELAGKRVKCPRCQNVTLVPQPEGELVEVAVEEDRVQKGPRPRTGRTGKLQRERPAAKGGGKFRVSRPQEQQEEAEVPQAKGPYQPCPRCGAGGAKRVKWTSWGSFYGPALFTHVECPRCGGRYNGKTGRSNALAIGAFVTAPLLGILAILAGVVYMVVQRGYGSF